MNNYKKYIPAILLILSLPFYFIGVFSLKSERGIKIMGSMGFWYIGLTGDYSDYRQYFYTRLANFINAVIILFIASIVFTIAYLCIFFLCCKNMPLKKYICITFAFNILSFGFYIAAVLFEAMFYSNKFHASYVIQNEGRLGFGIYLGLLLHIAAFVINYIYYVKLVFNPYIERKRAEKLQPLNQNENTQDEYPNTAPVCATDSGLKYYLFCSKGSLSGGKIELKNNCELKIGKDSRLCSLVIDKKYKNVSRLHCGVLRKNTDFYIIDYSTNGTFLSVDDTRMQSGGVLNKIPANQTFNLAHTENEFYCKMDKNQSEGESI